MHNGEDLSIPGQLMTVVTDRLRVAMLVKPGRPPRFNDTKDHAYSWRSTVNPFVCVQGNSEAMGGWV